MSSPKPITALNGRTLYIEYEGVEYYPMTYFEERTCRITYREDCAPEQNDCQIIECSNGCFFYWPTCTPLFYCPKCGARVVNENKPVEVWQQASADDVTCYEVEQ